MYSVIGSFTVQSGVLRVTDPCYKRGTWCAGTIENVEIGRWVGVIEIVEDWGIRSGTLYIAVERKFPGITEDGLPWVKTDINVGVDSGQAGFFDDDFYPQDEVGEYGDLTTFYGQACALTTSDSDRYKMAGTLHFGAVSSSGLGDGSYNCYVLKDRKGVIIAAKIVFLGDEDDEDMIDDE